MWFSNLLKLTGYGRTFVERACYGEADLVVIVVSFERRLYSDFLFAAAERERAE